LPHRVGCQQRKNCCDLGISGSVKLGLRFGGSARDRVIEIDAGPLEEVFLGDEEE